MDDQHSEIDPSAVPDEFKGEDGTPDLAAMRKSFDALRGNVPPESPDGYELKAPDLKDLDLPEGFKDIAEHMQLEIDADDPTIAELREMAHRHGMGQGAVDSVLKLYAERQIRDIAEGAAAAQAELEKLGPHAQSRLESLARTVRGRLPEAEAEALLDEVTTADSLRALEVLLGSGQTQAPGAQPGGKADLGDMSVDERLALAAEQRQRGGFRIKKR